MSKRVAYKGKVEYKGVTVAGMVSWSITGQQADQIDSSEFLDVYKTYKLGQITGATVSFSGHHDPDNTGVTGLVEAHDSQEDVTNLKFYIDATSGYVPNQTAGYMNPASPTGYNSPVSVINIMTCNVNYDSGANLGKIDFSGICSGAMVIE